MSSPPRPRTRHRPRRIVRHALRHGFDEFFGILSGAGDYFTHQAANKEKDLWENLKSIDRVGSLTDLLSDRVDSAG